MLTELLVTTALLTAQPIQQAAGLECGQLGVNTDAWLQLDRTLEKSDENASTYTVSPGDSRIHGFEFTASLEDDLLYGYTTYVTIEAPAEQVAAAVAQHYGQPCASTGCTIRPGGIYTDAQLKLLPFDGGVYLTCNDFM